MLLLHESLHISSACLSIGVLPITLWTCCVWTCSCCPKHHQHVKWKWPIYRHLIGNIQRFRISIQAFKYIVHVLKYDYGNGLYFYQNFYHVLSVPITWTIRRLLVSSGAKTRVWLLELEGYLAGRKRNGLFWFIMPSDWFAELISLIVFLEWWAKERPASNLSTYSMSYGTVQSCMTWFIRIIRHCVVGEVDMTLNWFEALYLLWREFPDQFLKLLSLDCLHMRCTWCLWNST